MRFSPKSECWNALVAVVVQEDTGYCIDRYLVLVWPGWIHVV